MDKWRSERWWKKSHITEPQSRKTCISSLKSKCGPIRRSLTPQISAKTALPRIAMCKLVYKEKPAPAISFKGRLTESMIELAPADLFQIRELSEYSSPLQSKKNDVSQQTDAAARHNRNYNPLARAWHFELKFYPGRKLNLNWSDGIYFSGLFLRAKSWGRNDDMLQLLLFTSPTSDRLPTALPLPLFSLLQLLAAVKNFHSKLQRNFPPLNSAETQAAQVALRLTTGRYNCSAHILSFLFLASNALVAFFPSPAAKVTM